MTCLDTDWVPLTFISQRGCLLLYGERACAGLGGPSTPPPPPHPDFLGALAFTHLLVQLLHVNSSHASRVAGLFL